MKDAILCVKGSCTNVYISIQGMEQCHCIASPLSTTTIHSCDVRICNIVFVPLTHPPYLSPSPTYLPYPSPSPVPLTCPPHLSPSPVPLTCPPHLSPSPVPLTCPPYLSPSPSLSPVPLTSLPTCPPHLSPLPVPLTCLPHPSPSPVPLTCPPHPSPSPVPRGGSEQQKLYYFPFQLHSTLETLSCLSHCVVHH